MSFNKKDFFDEYKSKHKKPVGIPNLRLNRPYGKQSRYTGDIGLELEVEGLNLPTEGSIEHIQAPSNNAFWLPKRDGSLRNGMEYVFNKPTKIEDIPFMVNRLWDIFKRSTLQNTNRCSTHVHINMKNRKINEITSVILLWTVFEEIMINWCGEFRIKNHHCLSALDSRGTIDAWNDVLTNGRGARDLPNGIKYSALNILTLHTFGSLEFRCGMAPNSPDEVISWTTFLYNLTQYAFNNYQDPYRIANDLSERGAEEMLEDICSYPQGEEFLESVKEKFKQRYSEVSLNEVCMKGFRNCQDLVYNYPWLEWGKEINKVYVPDPFTRGL